MRLFDPAIPVSDSDPLYIALRDHPRLADARACVEELWARFAPFADSGFIQDIALHFHARYWEMYLGCLIQDAGFSLIPPRNKGPDISVKLPSERRLYIEAVAPGPGTTEDAVPEPEPFRNLIAGDVPVEKIVLRIRSVIEKKFEKYGSYLKDNVIQANDLYIIAINPGIIEKARTDEDPPFILQSVFPIGNLMDIFDRNDPAFRDVRYDTRWAINKNNGEAIQTNVFLDSAYCGLSAVLFSNAHALTLLPRPTGTEVVLVHNREPRNPIERGALKIGREYWLEGDRICATDWNKERT